MGKNTSCIEKNVCTVRMTSTNAHCTLILLRHLYNVHGTCIGVTINKNSASPTPVILCVTRSKGRPPGEVFKLQEGGGGGDLTLQLLSSILSAANTRMVLQFGYQKGICVLFHSSIVWHAGCIVKPEVCCVHIHTHTHMQLLHAPHRYDDH